MNRESNAYKLLVRSYQIIARRMWWLNELRARGVRLIAPEPSAPRKRDSFPPIGWLLPYEMLEGRVLLSVTAAMNGGAATFSGDDASDNLYLRVNQGALQYSLDGSTYASDLNTNISAQSVINVNLGGGDDTLWIDSSLDSALKQTGATLKFDGGAGVNSLAGPGTDSIWLIKPVSIADKSGRSDERGAGEVKPIRLWFC